MVVKANRHLSDALAFWEMNSGEWFIAIPLTVYEE